MLSMIKNAISNVIIKFIAFCNTQKNKQLIKDKILTVGDHSYYASDLKIDTYKGSEAKVLIGKYCSVGPNVRIITGGIHQTEWVSTFPFRIKFDLLGKYEDGLPSTKGDVIIGIDVWIGTSVTILSGISIGHGAVISAGAVVTKNVLPYSIMGGIPAKIIKLRFSKEQISNLLRISWWDWPKDMILANANLLSSSNIDKFIEKHSPSEI